MNAHESDDLGLSPDALALLDAGKSEVTDYDYERGLSAHLALVAAPVAASTSSSAAGSGATAAKVVAGGGAAGVAANVASSTSTVLAGTAVAEGSTATALVSTALASSKAWLAWLALPFATAGVAAALYFSGSPAAGTAPSKAAPADEHAQGPTTPVVAVNPTTGAVTENSEEEAAGRDRAPHAGATKSSSRTASTQRVDSSSRHRARRGAAGDDLPPEKITLSENVDDRMTTEGVYSTGAAGEDARSDQPASKKEDISSREVAKEEAIRRERNVVEQESKTDRLRLEMDQLMEAKRALASNPGRALSLAREGEHSFGKSTFSEERQHVLILALLSLGRLSEAERLAAPYLQNHPGSPFAKRVQKALDAAAAKNAH